MSDDVVSQIDEALFRAAPTDYGANYRGHLFEQYKLYVESADRISSRRDKTNNFFVTVNTALLAFVGLSQSVSGDATGPTSAVWLALVAAGGVVLCSAWYGLIRSYRDLNRAKFRVINRMEEQLPVAVYDAEWESLGRGRRPDLYRPFTRLESLVPWVFSALYLVAFGMGLVAEFTPASL